MANSEIKIEWVDVKAIKPHPKNNNKHTKDQIERLAKIIRYQGQRTPLVVSNLSGFLVKGHATLEAIKKNGTTTVAVTYQDFDDAAQEYAYMTSDNAIAEWSEIDLSQIKIDVPDLGEFDHDLLGFKEFHLDPETGEGGGDADAVPEAPKVPKSKLGELWTLGQHRLLCGDSTDKATVEKLMNGEKADMVFTDPPYGMNYQLGTTKKKISKILGDEREFEVSDVWGIIQNVPVKYICTRFDKYVQWQNQIPEPVKNIIIWVKSNMGAGDLSNYGYQHELIMYWGNGIDGKRDTNVWNEGNTPKKEYVGHPTQKPIILIERALLNHKNNNVLDLFGGSGSTLIACEKTKRKCFMMELDPIYIDVILQRWADFTGKDPVREDGVTWSSLQTVEDEYDA